MQKEWHEVTLPLDEEGLLKLLAKILTCLDLSSYPNITHTTCDCAFSDFGVPETQFLFKPSIQVPCKCTQRSRYVNYKNR
jgi:hypothetical protein